MHRFCIKASKNCLQEVAGCSGLVCYVATVGRLWFPKAVNIFVTKAYCLLCLWFGVFYVFWAGKLVDLETHPRLALLLRHAFSPFLQGITCISSNPRCSFMKTFAAITPKPRPVSCRRWEESSHLAELARYFLEDFVTSVVCRQVCRKPFSCMWQVSCSCTWGQLDHGTGAGEESSSGFHTFLFWRWDLYLNLKSSSSCLLSCKSTLILSNLF